MEKQHFFVIGFPDGMYLSELSSFSKRDYQKEDYCEQHIHRVPEVRNLFRAERFEDKAFADKVLRCIKRSESEIEDRKRGNVHEISMFYKSPSGKEEGMEGEELMRFIVLRRFEHSDKKRPIFVTDNPKQKGITRAIDSRVDFARDVLLCNRYTLEEAKRIAKELNEQTQEVFKDVPKKVWGHRLFEPKVVIVKKVKIKFS